MAFFMLPTDEGGGCGVGLGGKLPIVILSSLSFMYSCRYEGASTCRSILKEMKNNLKTNKSIHKTSTTRVHLICTTTIDDTPRSNCTQLKFSMRDTTDDDDEVINKNFDSVSIRIIDMRIVSGVYVNRRFRQCKK